MIFVYIYFFLFEENSIKFGSQDAYSNPSIHLDSGVGMWVHVLAHEGNILAGFLSNISIAAFIKE